MKNKHYSLVYSLSLNTLNVQCLSIQIKAYNVALSQTLTAPEPVL